jgi:hypothetical protein
MTWPSRYLIEIETHPGKDRAGQLLRDTLLVFLDSNELPEVVVLVLCTRRQVRVVDHAL